jgi:hypothetical protein
MIIVSSKNPIFGEQLPVKKGNVPNQRIDESTVERTKQDENGIHLHQRRLPEGLWAVCV